MYAEAGIKDYWIVNLLDRCVEVYREPDGATYRGRRIYARRERISPLASPDVTLRIALLFE